MAPSVAVVGGGIGGLTAAVALLRAGLDVRVYEQARTLPAVGAGIQLAPNCTRILGRLGLLPAVARVGVRPTAFEFRRWDDGRVLSRTPLGDSVETAYGAPYFHAHRGDLVTLLADAVPADRVEVGRRCVGVEPRGERAEVVFADGSRTTADVVVGADGIHSAVRQSLFGDDRPRFTGHVAYRGLIPAEPTGAPGPGAPLHRPAGARSARRPLLRERRPAGERGVRDRGERVATGVVDRPGRRRRTPRGLRTDGTRSSGRSSAHSTPRSSGPCSTATRCRAGAADPSRSSATPAIRCCPYGAQGYAQAVEDAAVLAACLAVPALRDIPAARGPLHRTAPRPGGPGAGDLAWERCAVPPPGRAGAADARRGDGGELRARPGDRLAVRARFVGEPE